MHDWWKVSIEYACVLLEVSDQAIIQYFAQAGFLDVV